MVTVDHFKQELRARMERAATQSATDILINSGELCRSLHRFTGNLGLVACCDAMQAEMKPGDVVVIERSAGLGMTVRYLLPRTTG